MWVIRPCDPNEVAVAWDMAISRKDGPTAIILTRQKVPTLDRNIHPPAESIRRGAYVLADAGGGEPDLLIMASGSEVHIALSAKKMLEDRGLGVRIVNMASFEVFELQDEEYKRSVIPKHIKRRAAIEAGVGLCWYKYVGEDGLVIGIERFGKSAPYKDLVKDFGFTPEAVAEKIIKHFGLE
jgi:transketolase